MDSEDVLRLVEELKLTADAGEAVITLKEEDLPGKGEEGGARFERFVVGKIFAARVVNRETLKVQIPRILQTRGIPDIEIVGDNLFVVVFTNDRDRQHALVDGPWHFFDNLMMFKEPKGMEKPSDVVFDTFTTWIQCHNLPIMCMNPGMVRKIAEHVGHVMEIDVGEGGNCLGQYARARVSRNVGRPLQRCVSIAAGADDEKHIILIRYERLPVYCSACGRVGHDVRHCDDETVEKQKKPFGVWLKATRTIEGRRGRGEIHRHGTYSGMTNSMNPEPFSKGKAEEEKGVMVVGPGRLGEREGCGECVRGPGVEESEMRENEEEEEGIQSHMEEEEELDRGEEEGGGEGDGSGE